jgi:hypothetical protein
MKIILAVDPGKKSGICSFKFDKDTEPELIFSGEYLMPEYHTPIIETLSMASSKNLSLDIVCERFTINAQTVKNSQAPYSLEQIGILKYLAMSAGFDHEGILFQSPSDAKRMFSNDALKKLEYWHRGGEGHALDAIRHGLLRAVKLGWMPTRLLSQ